MVGDQVWLVVLVWLAAAHSSPGVAGLVIGAASVPRALLLVVTGAYVDRHDPVRLALVSDVARAGVFVLAATVAALGDTSGSPALGFARPSEPNEPVTLSIEHDVGVAGGRSRVGHCRHIDR